MKNSYHIYPVIIILTILLSACNLKPISLGEMQEKRVEISKPFNTLVLQDITTIHIYPSENNYAEIRAKEKLMNKLKLDVSENSLCIKNSLKNKWLSEGDVPEVHLYVKEINKIIIEKPCRIYSSEVLNSKNLELIQRCDISKICIIINTGNLKYWSSNTATADVVVKGECKRLNIEMHGSVKFSAFDLKCNSADIVTGSVNVTEVSVNDTLCSRTYHKGSVLYKGDPFIINHPEGSANIIKTPN